jgi:dihydroxyacetone synthase
MQHGSTETALFCAFYLLIECESLLIRLSITSSNGHACLLQYIYLHLCGYPTWTLEMLKRYHSRDFLHSQAAGHPEIEFEGIELTTGPLGQGLANAVGLAMASKHLAATFNQDDHQIVDNKIWVMSGDGCLQEGVGQEGEFNVHLPHRFV